MYSLIFSLHYHIIYQQKVSLLAIYRQKKQGLAEIPPLCIIVNNLVLAHNIYLCYFVTVLWKKFNIVCKESYRLYKFAPLIKNYCIKIPSSSSENNLVNSFFPIIFALDFEYVCKNQRVKVNYDTLKWCGLIFRQFIRREDAVVNYEAKSPIEVGCNFTKVFSTCKQKLLLFFFWILPKLLYAIYLLFYFILQQTQLLQ